MPGTWEGGSTPGPYILPVCLEIYLAVAPINTAAAGVKGLSVELAGRCERRPFLSSHSLLILPSSLVSSRGIRTLNGLFGGVGKDAHGSPFSSSYVLAARASEGKPKPEGVYAPSEVVLWADYKMKHKSTIPQGNLLAWCASHTAFSLQTSMEVLTWCLVCFFTERLCHQSDRSERAHVHHLNKSHLCFPDLA